MLRYQLGSSFQRQDLSPRSVAARAVLHSQSRTQSDRSSASNDDVQHLLSRRQLLSSTAALTTGSVLVTPSCSQAVTQMQLDGEAIQAYDFQVPLRLVTLRGSVPSNFLTEFKTLVGKPVSFAVEQRTQLYEIFEELKDFKKQKGVPTADAVTLGDVFLGPAIQRGLIRPLDDIIDPRWWDYMSPQWSEVCRRDHTGHADPSGHIWAVPYRWGCTLIAYRKDKLQRQGGREIQDWGDLLQPKLKMKVAFVDAPREFVGAALKCLGASYNTSFGQLSKYNLKEKDMQQTVQQLRRQCRLVSNRDHTRALAAGDVCAVVGWSTDLLQLAARSSNIGIVAPASGTALWGDMWVSPVGAKGGTGGQGPSPMLPVWLEFGLMPERAKKLKALNPYGASPLLLPGAKVGEWMDESDNGSSPDNVNSYLPPKSVVQKSEFLLPLDPETLAMYGRLIRT